MFDRNSMTERYGIALIPSTRDAMAAEAQAQAAQLQVRIIPTPGRIQANCGFSLKYELAEEAQLLALLQQMHIACEGLYEAEQRGLAAAYTRRGKD